MKNNTMFKRILQITGLIKDVELVIRLFEMGEEPFITESLIRGWREDTSLNRKTNMPDELLEAFFQGLFKYRDLQKKEGIQVFDFGIDFKSK